MMDMDIQLIQFLIILSLMIISFIFELVPMEVTALGTLGLLLCFNIINIDEAISGFSNKAVITIGCIFIISKALVKTGFIEVFADFLYRLAGNRKWISFIVFFITTSFISGFINNTAAVAIFIPLAINLCQKYHISPTKILLPLSYAAIFGGTLTLIGTSTNLLVNNFLETSTNLPPFKMFEFTKLGLIFVFVGTVYNIIIAKWILPSRAITTSLTQKYHMSTYLTEFKVPYNSKLIGKSLNDISTKRDYEYDIIKIIRNKVELSISLRDTILFKDDVLLVQLNLKDIVKFKDDLELLMLSDIKMSQDELAGKNHVLVEGVISQESNIINKTLTDLNYRQRFGSFVLAIKRQTELLREKVAHIKLKFSDTLLIMVPKNNLEELRGSNDLIILEELDIHLKYERYWWLSIIVIPFIMIFASLNIISITEGAILGAILLLVLKSLSIQDAYESINWSVIFLIALLIPIGIAMKNTGAGDYLSKIIIGLSISLNLDPYYQAIAVISILYFFTFITSAFISNAAVAIILSPLALILGKYFQVMDPNVAIDPTKAFLMAICFGASTSFMTPIGYQTNLMVFGPGQYKFKDFMYYGLPLTLIFWGLASYLIPIFWPII
tara:strand:+ start:501 stop:2336 length:1836 start_codon:yes stop_codon:yes gene_type:complete